MDLRPSRRLCRRKALVLTQLSNSAVITSSIGKQAIQISSGSTFTFFLTLRGTAKMVLAQ